LSGGLGILGDDIFHFSLDDKPISRKDNAMDTVLVEFFADCSGARLRRVLPDVCAFAEVHRRMAALHS
jgi:hypothetical protein